MLERKSENPSEEKQITFFQKTVENLRCPITLLILYDPVVASCGDVFERSAIQEFTGQNDYPRCP